MLHRPAGHSLPLCAPRNQDRFRHSARKHSPITFVAELRHYFQVSRTSGAGERFWTSDSSSFGPYNQDFRSYVQSAPNIYQPRCESPIYSGVDRIRCIKLLDCNVGGLQTAQGSIINLPLLQKHIIYSLQHGSSHTLCRRRSFSGSRHRQRTPSCHSGHLKARQGRRIGQFNMPGKCSLLPECSLWSQLLLRGDAWGQFILPNPSRAMTYMAVAGSDCSNSVLGHKAGHWSV